MPEGDTYARAASRLRAALVGHTLTRVAGSAPAARRWSGRLTGRRVEAVRTHGKHLMVDLEHEVSIHTWLGMPGSWRVAPAARRTPADPGAVRLLLATREWQAACVAAPVVEVDRREVIEHGLRRLGPDLLAADLDRDALVERLGLYPRQRPVADLLLDQRVAAGLGNEYKSELLFLAGIHPATPVGEVEVERLVALMERGRRLLEANRGRGRRVTTGLPGRGRELWVYDREGKPCRRCRSAIAASFLGAPPRITYWCPACQPAPTAATR